MTTLSCRAVFHLLPLFAEELLCEDAQTLIGVHLQSCDACRAALTAHCRRTCAIIHERRKDQ